MLKTSVTLWVVSVSVCVGASQRISLSFLARNPHKGPAREIFHETGSGRWKVAPREEDSQQKGAAETSRHERSVKRRTQTAEGRAEKTVDRDESRAEKISQHCLWFWESFCSSKAHRMHKKCHRPPPSCTWSRPKSVFVRLFFSSTLSVVLCVSVNKCEIPLTRDEKKP